LLKLYFIIILQNIVFDKLKNIVFGEFCKNLIIINYNIYSNVRFSKLSPCYLLLINLIGRVNMTRFFLMGFSVLLLLFSACNSVIKHAPSSQEKITELQNNLDRIRGAPAIDTQGRPTGKNVWAQLGKKCPGETEFHKRYCPKIQELESQIALHKARANTTVAHRGNREIFPTISSTTSSAPQSLVGADRRADDNAEHSPQIPQHNCQGIPPDVAPQVLKFLSCPVVQILAQPDSVESYRVQSKPDPNVAAEKRLGRFPIEVDGKGQNIEGPNLTKLQKLLFTENSYVFGSEKRCRFRPEMGLHFVKGQDAVEVLFAVPCRLWLFVHGKEEKLEDFDRIVGQLTFLNALLTKRPVTQEPAHDETFEETSTEAEEIYTEEEEQGQLRPIGTIQGPADIP